MTAGDTSAFTFLPLGAIIQEFCVDGQNIVLGFPTQEQYVKYNTPYFGATIGRVANRIKDGVIENLNGKTYKFAINNSPNSLHGGEKGWDKQLWEGPTTVTRNGKAALHFKYLSKDGDEGYPGTVEARVWYAARKEEVDTSSPKTILEVEYEVEFVGDECEETVVNVTNHSHFNLSGGPNLEGTHAQLCTNNYLPVDSTGIPSGNIDQFPRDTSAPFLLGPSQPHIDDCFVTETDPSKIPLDTRNQPLKLLAAFKHATTGLHLEVHSTEPAFQFYTGKYTNVPAVEGAPARGEGAGFCVEPSRYVNAPNEKEWRGMVLLKKGQVYGSKNMYRAWRE